MTRLAQLTCKHWSPKCNRYGPQIAQGVAHLEGVARAMLSEHHKLALEHARQWFQIHAEQRLRLVNFYVAVMVGSLAVAGGLIKIDSDLAKICLGLYLVLVTFIFQELDKRTAQLVKLSERALEKLEDCLSQELSISELQLVKRAEIKTGVFSYRQLLQLLYWAGYVLGLLVALQAVFQ